MGSESVGDRIGPVPGVSTCRSAREEGELRLLARVREGDADAFEALFRLYHPRIVRFLANLVRRPTIVEEVLDDTMMVVWERAGSFNGASRLSTWIFGIAYRRAMRSLRQQDLAQEDEAPDRHVASGPTPEQECGQGQVQRLLLAAMKELSADHRAVVDLCYFHDLGYREIAEIMGCPVATVKTRMFHARRHLRRKLEGELDEWI